MFSVEFDYSKLNKVYAPIIPIQIKGRDNLWHEVWVYVDSGATYSILKIQEAERLGIDFRSGIRITVTVGDGGLIPVYLHRLILKIGKNKINATIGFSEKLGVNFNLLGRQDIFNKFRIYFRESKRKIRFILEK